MIDLKNEFTKIVKVQLQKMIKKEFDTESDYNGIAWKPKKVPNGKPILIDSGKLRRSFKYTQNNQVQLSNKVSYFNNATKDRPVIPDTMPQDVKSEVHRNLADFLDKNVKTIIKQHRSK